MRSGFPRRHSAFCSPHHCWPAALPGHGGPIAGNHSLPYETVLDGLPESGWRAERRSRYPLPGPRGFARPQTGGILGEEEWHIMNRMVVNSRIGSDGVLHVTVPVGRADADREVRV